MVLLHLQVGPSIDNYSAGHLGVFCHLACVRIWRFCISLLWSICLENGHVGIDNPLI